MAQLVLALWMSLFMISPSALNQINTRRSYYPKLIGVAFENKYMFRLNKIEDAVFKFLDPNFYLFASHPRENG